jgi:hypothetical protein
MTMVAPGRARPAPVRASTLATSSSWWARRRAQDLVSWELPVRPRITPRSPRQSTPCSAAPTCSSCCPQPSALRFGCSWTVFRQRDGLLGGSRHVDRLRCHASALRHHKKSGDNCPLSDSFHHSTTSKVARRGLHHLLPGAEAGRLADEVFPRFVGNGLEVFFRLHLERTRLEQLLEAGMICMGNMKVDFNYSLKLTSC